MIKLVGPVAVVVDGEHPWDKQVRFYPVLLHLFVGAQSVSQLEFELILVMSVEAEVEQFIPCFTYKNRKLEETIKICS